FLGALVLLRLAFHLQRFVVGQVAGGFLEFALGVFHDAHVDHTFAFCALRSRASYVRALARCPSAFACSRIALSFSVPLACCASPASISRCSSKTSPTTSLPRP